MNRIGIQMVHTCPPNFAAGHVNEEANMELLMLVKKCESWPTMGAKLDLFDGDGSLYPSIPITTESGITYANYFCAVCNGVAEDFLYWKLIVQGIPKREGFLYSWAKLDWTRASRFPSFIHDESGAGIKNFELGKLLCFMPSTDEWTLDSKMAIFVCLLTSKFDIIKWSYSCMDKIPHLGPIYYSFKPRFDLTVLVSDVNLKLDMQMMVGPAKLATVNKWQWSCNPQNRTVFADENIELWQ